MKLFSNASQRKIYKTKEHQTGTSDLVRDRSRFAKPVGKRISITGKIYYESRKSRSDKKGSMV